MTRPSNLTVAIEEQKAIYGHLLDANRDIEGKAATILQSSSFVTAAVTAAKLLGPGVASVGRTVLVVVLLALFGVMVGLALYVWLPRKKQVLPFKSEWDKWFENVVDAEQEEAARLVLSSYVDVTQVLQRINDRTGVAVMWAAVLLAGQILVAALLVALV